MIHFLKKFAVLSCTSVMLIKHKSWKGGYFALFNKLISYCKSFHLIPNLQNLILKYSKVIYFSPNYKIRYLFRICVNFLDPTRFFMERVWVWERYERFRTSLDVKYVNISIPNIIILKSKKSYETSM